MKTLNLIFLVHEPRRLKPYTFFDIGDDHYYYDDFYDYHRLNYLCEECFLPTNRILENIINSSAGKVKLSFAITGTMLSMLEANSPDTLESFVRLAKTGCVEFMAMPYSYSLSSLFDSNEFKRQVRLHIATTERLLGVRPTSFINTALIYTDTIGEWVADIGLKVSVIENAKHVMGWKPPQALYTHPKRDMKLLVRDSHKSDLLSLYFSDPQRSITAERMADLIKTSTEQAEAFNIVFGYDSFGIRNKKESGIFEFLKALPYYCIENHIEFSTPREVAERIKPFEKLPILYPISWHGEDRDTNAYTGNDLQEEALNKLYSISSRINMLNDNTLLQDWYNIQDAANLYAMSEDYFRYTTSENRQYESIYQAFTNYMNILSDFIERVKTRFPNSVEDEELNSLLKTIRGQNDEIKKLKAEILRLKHAKN